MKFRKKPVVIDALQLRWDNWSEMCDFAGVGHLADGKPEGFNPGGDPNVIGLRIPTLEGVMEAKQDDWIIRGIKGELYPCKPEIFDASYEAVHADHCAFPHMLGKMECPSAGVSGGPSTEAP